jgi:hypothetical protein
LKYLFVPRLVSWLPQNEGVAAWDASAAWGRATTHPKTKMKNKLGYLWPSRSLDFWEANALNVSTKEPLAMDMGD